MRESVGMIVIVIGLVLVMIAAGCASNHTANSEPPKLGTKAWYLEIERKISVVDKDGHGPDTGSTEWLEAVSRKVKVYDDQGHGPDLDSGEWKHCVHRKVFKEDPITHKKWPPEQN